jgi:hypothetical protein
LRFLSPICPLEKVAILGLELMHALKELVNLLFGIGKLESQVGGSLVLYNESTRHKLEIAICGLF